MIAGLDHVTINTANLAATELFFTEIVGLELARRPDLGIPGIWLKARNGSNAIVHVLEVENQHPDTVKKRATIDHIAFHAQNFPNVMSKLLETKTPWWGNVIADFGLWQLMFYDPNGALIEMNFKADSENCPTPEIPDKHKISRLDFFSPQE